jgi:mitogen-activated protein kinase kinase kinase
LLASRRQSLQGSVFWMAPEVVKQAPYTNKADIWSVGCLIVEMLTGEHPWGKLNQMQAMFKVRFLLVIAAKYLNRSYFCFHQIGSSMKPQIPPDITPQLEDFLSKTFELDINARPSAAELLLHPWLIKEA